MKGTWSSTLPSCIPIQCSPLEIASPHLQLLSLNNSFMGEASFACPFGYRLTGKKSIVCTKTGAWSGLVPDCEGKCSYSKWTMTLCLSWFQLSHALHLNPLYMVTLFPLPHTMQEQVCKVFATLATSQQENLSLIVWRREFGLTPYHSVGGHVATPELL